MQRLYKCTHQELVVQQANGALRRQLTTDATGAYQAADLPAGAYTIVAVLPSGYRLTTAATTSTTIQVGATTAPAIGAVVTLNLPAIQR